MYSITDSSVVLRWLVSDFSSLCTTEMDLSITRLFVSKTSKHTLITPHGIGYSVWSSLTPSLLQFKAREFTYCHIRNVTVGRVCGVRADLRSLVIISYGCA